MKGVFSGNSGSVPIWINRGERSIMGFDDAKPSNGGEISQNVVSNVISGGGFCVVKTHYSDFRSSEIRCFPQLFKSEHCRNPLKIDNNRGRSYDGAVLYYAAVFLIIAVVAAILGFGGIAGTADGIAKILFLVFLVLFLVSLLFGRKPPAA